MSAPVDGSGSAEPQPTARILDAVYHRLVSDGASTLALNDIARDAGVSKALIHYHFRDKAELLAHAVDRTGAQLLDRERGALTAYRGKHSPLAVDALWHWLERELQNGSLRALAALTDYPAPVVRARMASVQGARRAQAARTIEALFTNLDLRPRIAPALLGSVFLSFIDGLALATAPAERFDDESASSARVAFDVFWLAMLSLAE